MKLTFCGAARQVTGSMYLLALDSGYQVLIDCGLNYEKDVPRESNADFPYDPETLDLVVLTHAHIDHSGNLPTLFAKGYQGQVICTEPTAALADILLSDSANIEAKRVNKSRRGKKKVRRLYGHKQVFDVVESFVTLDFNTVFQVNNELSLELIPAGHILGAASVKFYVKESGKTKTIGFTGDLGQQNDQLAPKPQPLGDLNYLVMESTYGSRVHNETRPPKEVLHDYITKVCLEQRNGRLIIPAFSVGRTQSILYTLNRLFREHEYKGVRVVTDSPLGISSGKIHDRFTSFLRPEAQMFQEETGDLFLFRNLLIAEEKEDDIEWQYSNDSVIIVSSAGMLDGGRIQRHIANNIQNPNCTILIAGYCTPGTLGARLLEGNKHVRIGKHDRSVYAQIASTDVFSAHPDQKELIEYFQSVRKSSELQHVFLTHGDVLSSEQLGELLSTDYKQITIPSIGDSFDL